MDRLDAIFEKRQRFMDLLESVRPGSYPPCPLDLSDKGIQQRLRDLALRGVEEMFEAVAHLKNWKSHRFTNVPEFDRDSFLEETVDAFNYFLALLIQVGVTPDEFFDAFEKKDEIIRRRIKERY